MTNQEMNESLLFPNRALKEAIQKWRENPNACSNPNAVTGSNGNFELERLRRIVEHLREVYFDATSKIIKFRDTNELVTRNHVEISFPDGDKYRGGVKDGYPHGKFILYDKDGNEKTQGDTLYSVFLDSDTAPHQIFKHVTDKCSPEQGLCAFLDFLVLSVHFC